MVDVSAQDRCTITPINPTTLTAAGGELANGTKNVMINCNCTASDGYIIKIVRWYGPDGTRLRLAGFVPGTPHILRAGAVDDNTNIILVIPRFNDFYDGTYTCGRRISVTQFGQPTGTITLTASELMIIQAVTVHI